MAGNDREDLTVTESRHFWKMTGSGNDFVFVDGRDGTAREFHTPATIQRICARGTGVGADGLVILSEPTVRGADLALTYYNADGSLAALCGNATLCTASLGARLGLVDPAGFGLQTGAGVLRARIRDGLPEFDLPGIPEPVAALPAVSMAGSERRLGFATAGIPHVVIRVPDVVLVDVENRGRTVRHDAALAEGANVNFVSAVAPGRWKIRTYERGVEDETLACGTGCVATALMLKAWDEAAGDVDLETASGRVVSVRAARAADGSWTASLRGEGRLVFEGELREI